MPVMMGEIMKNKTLHGAGVLFAIVLAMLLWGVPGSGVSVAGMEKKPIGNLDEFHADNDVTCAGCHDGAEKKAAVEMSKCLECHDTTALAEKTAAVSPTNPHENRHYSTEADCNLCHHQHKPSENFCLPCHARFDFQVP